LLQDSSLLLVLLLWLLLLPCQLTHLVHHALNQLLHTYSII
jgi:hypothetical protein